MKEKNMMMMMMIIIIISCNNYAVIAVSVFLIIKTLFI